MTMDKDTSDDPVLNALFDAGKTQRPAPGEAFLARLASDVEAAVPQPAVRRTTSPTVSVFARFKGLFAASGLSSAAALGLWIGFVAPDVITNVSPLSEDVATLSAFLPSSDLLVLSE